MKYVLYKDLEKNCTFIMLLHLNFWWKHFRHKINWNNKYYMSYSHICASKIVIMLRFIHAYTILSVDKMLQCKKYSDTTSGKRYKCLATARKNMRETQGTTSREWRTSLRCRPLRWLLCRYSIHWEWRTSLRCRPLWWLLCRDSVH